MSTCHRSGSQGLYMDEQTRGHTVAHPSMTGSTVMTAGIEPAYSDIKNMTLPPLAFP